MLRKTIAALVLVSCTGQLQNPNAPKLENCPVACAHLRELGCELGTPTPRGKSCEDLCKVMESNGVRFISCTINASSCESADACN